MKLIRADKKSFVFAMGRREKHLLLGLLKLYPLVPATHHRLSKPAKAGQDDENQHLLDEAIAAQRRENRQQVQALLNEPGRFKETESGFHLTLSPPQMDWLLQVLNDVRIGSWLNLGSPDTEEREQLVVNEKTSPSYWAMEVAGFFEMALVEAMSGQLYA
jgi:hypothetical protein